MTTQKEITTYPLDRVFLQSLPSEKSGYTMHDNSVHYCTVQLNGNTGDYSRCTLNFYCLMYEHRTQGEYILVFKRGLSYLEGLKFDTEKAAYAASKDFFMKHLKEYMEF